MGKLLLLFHQVKGLPFNQYSWLTTHNSFALTGARPPTSSALLAPTNQEDSITTQLQVRSNSNPPPLASKLIALFALFSFSFSFLLVSATALPRVFGQTEIWLSYSTVLPIFFPSNKNAAELFVIYLALLISGTLLIKYI